MDAINWMEIVNEQCWTNAYKRKQYKCLFGFFIDKCLSLKGFFDYNL